jgi:hypothetical protein
MKKNILSPATEKMVHYSIYREKKEELQSFLDKEVITWGGYKNIPDYIQRVIDRELVAIGRYAKRIDAQSIEAELV